MNDLFKGHLSFENAKIDHCFLLVRFEDRSRRVWLHAGHSMKV